MKKLASGIVWMSTGNRQMISDLAIGHFAADAFQHISFAWYRVLRQG
jgi:hypothetical protein